MKMNHSNALSVAARLLMNWTMLRQVFVKGETELKTFNKEPTQKDPIDI